MTALLLLAACTRCDPGEICAVIGTGELGFNADGLPALETRLASPTSVTTDPAGRVVVVDFSNMRVRVLTEEGTIETIVGVGEHAYSELGRDALDTPLENPVDATWGPDGLLYVLCEHEGRLIRVGADGRIEAFAGTGVVSDGADGDDALVAEMGYGAGLAWASDGSFFISDNTFSRIRRVGPDGRIDSILGTGEGALGEPGHGPEVAIHSPERLVVDEERGRLLVADTLNNRVLVVDLETLDTTVLAGTGEGGYAGDGGPASGATLRSPVGLAVREDGTVLIADLENDVIRAVDLDGGIDTVAGGVDAEPIGDAPPLDFPMRRPAGMSWTEDGDLLIAERSGHRVLRWYGATDAI